MSVVLTVVKVGDAVPEVRTLRGDYDRWFRDGIGAPAEATRVVDPRRGDALPSPSEAGAVVVTGSSCMVTDRPAWSVATGDWLVRLVEEDVPLLGVCYGHQLLAEALGGEVGRNSRGREIGTIEVTLEPEAKRDPLFEVLPERAVFHATHRESVLRLPEGATRLGGNAHDPHQAYRVGPRAWCVQFHPEFDDAIIREYLRGRAEACRSEGLDVPALFAGIRPSPDGPKLLRRFGELAGF